jgi:hypothetical protein
MLLKADPTFYPSPQLAIQGPKEKLAYVAALNANGGFLGSLIEAFLTTRLLKLVYRYVPYYMYKSLDQHKTKTAASAKARSVALWTTWSVCNGSAKAKACRVSALTWVGGAGPFLAFSRARHFAPSAAYQSWYYARGRSIPGWWSGTFLHLLNG